MAKKLKQTNEIGLSQDELVSDLANSLNTKFKETNSKIAYILNSDKDSPNVVESWISTGNDIVDLAISNSPNGGLPVGRIIEIMGDTASGKSLLAGSILAQTQKKGGLAVYIDTENAVSNDFFSMLGVDLSKLLYIPMETLEDCFAAVEVIIEKTRTVDKTKDVCIVIDSIMGATTKIEMDAEYDKDGFATSKAIILSKAMRKITGMIGRQRICLVLINQLRDKVGTFGFGEKSCLDPHTSTITIRRKINKNK